MGSLVNLANYNNHKRRTLDRITGKYSRQMLSVYYTYTESLIDDFHRALERGDRKFKPRIDEKTERAIENIFVSHKKDTVFVSVADGFREVPLDETQKLNAWADYPLTVPIESTLTSLETKEAKTLADEIEERMGAKRPRFFMELIKQSKKDLLGQIRKAYRFAASDWLEGETSIRTVKEALSRSILRSKVGVERVFRTETTRYFNETRHEYFKQAVGVTHYQIFAITDGRVSKICESRHKYVVTKEDANLEKYRPPFHPNCRTILRPLMWKLASHRKRIEEGMAMDERRFEPLPKEWAA